MPFAPGPLRRVDGGPDYKKVATSGGPVDGVSTEEGTATELQSNEVGEDAGAEDEQLVEEGLQGVISEDYAYPVGPLRGPFAISDVPDVPSCIESILFKGRIGRLYVCRFCPRIGERIWCMMGPCWPMMLLTFTLIIGIGGGVHLYASNYVHWTILAGSGSILAFNVTALAFTACNNPGVLKRQTEPPENGQRWRFHTGAGAYQPPGSRYCDECQVFVRDYDHFCPWTGTAIAGNNLPFFYCFVGSLNLVCVSVFVLVFFSLAAAGRSHRAEMSHAGGAN